MNGLYRKLTVSTMMGLLMTPSWTYANEFFTIIGPDGRPMIVQKQAKKPVHTPDSAKTIQQASSSSLPPQTSSKQSIDQQEVTQVTVDAPKVSTTVKKIPLQIGVQKNTIVSQHDTATQIAPRQKQPEKRAQTSIVPSPVDQTVVAKQVDSAKNLPSIPLSEPVKTLPTTEDDVTASNLQRTKAEVSKIDGVEYINNEYLEDREFNLEGKKRFYVMPLYNDVQGGANAKIGHMETVEREKGVNKNFLNKMFNKEEKVEQPLTLATTYYRISKENVEQNLEQSCFTGKKVNKAKILGQKNADIGIWPTAPLTDSFEYEIVQVEGNLKDVKLTSYAASQKKPVFYWPLVVFLDQKGCVIEGVGGFKNQDTESTSLQYASIEGLIRLPEGTAYLFMTPLASAIDVEDKALSNHGQIKLSVLR